MVSQESIRDVRGPARLEASLWHGRIAVAGTKSYIAKPGEIIDKWWVVDATDKQLGRLASEVHAHLKHTDVLSSDDWWY